MLHVESIKAPVNKFYLIMRVFKKLEANFSFALFQLTKLQVQIQLDLYAPESCSLPKCNA